MKKLTHMKKYIVVFTITALIFALVFLFVGFLNSRKIGSLEKIQQGITADLIMLETQFDLLKSAPCTALENGALSEEVDALGKKITYMENTRGSDDEDVLSLKKYYALLQVKDFLLAKEVTEQCDFEVETILYFYRQDCSECRRQGYALTELKSIYPWIRIYSFDMDVETSLLNTFSSLYEINDELPALIIDNSSYSGLQSREKIEELIPQLIKEKEEKDFHEKLISYLEEEFSEAVDMESLKVATGESAEFSLLESTNTTSEQEGNAESDTAMIKITYDSSAQEFSVVEGE